MSLRMQTECAHAYGGGSAATIPLVSALPGQAIGLFRAIITANISTNVTFQDTAGAALSQTFPVGGIKQVIMNTQANGDPWLVTNAGKGFQLAQSGAATVGFDVWTRAGSYPAGVLGGGSPSPPTLVLTPTTWNPSSIIRMTLSGGNLTATTTTPNTGSVRAIVGQSTGKWYFEINGTLSQITDYIGIASTSSALPITINSVNNACGIDGIQRLWLNNTNPIGTTSLSTVTVPLFVAVDLDAKLIWFDLPLSVGWNGSATANPATGTGGVSIAALSMPVAPFSTVITTGNNVTANFGASAFSGAVPAGFTAGWGTLQ